MYNVSNSVWLIHSIRIKTLEKRDSIIGYYSKMQIYYDTACLAWLTLPDWKSFIILKFKDSLLNGNKKNNTFMANK